jgi:hypothetical protein
MDDNWNLVGAFALGIITCSLVGALMTSVSNTKPSFAPYAPSYRSDNRFYHRR